MYSMLMFEAEVLMSMSAAVPVVSADQGINIKSPAYKLPTSVAPINTVTNSEAVVDRFLK